VFLRGNWSVADFIAAYISIAIFIVVWVGWKVWHKTKWIPLEEIDFFTGRRELDLMEAADKEKFKPDTPWKKFCSILF
jgi:amino acid transporter